MPTGYDTNWTEELEEAILDIVSQGGTLKEIERKTGVKTSPLFLHRRKSKTFEQRYISAQEQGFEHDADKLKTAHEDIPDPLRARLFSENNRWLLSRRAAHRYGDRLDITVGQTVDMTQALIDARKRAGHSVEYFDTDILVEATKKIERIAHDNTNSDNEANDASSDNTNSDNEANGVTLNANNVVKPDSNLNAKSIGELIDIIS